MNAAHFARRFDRRLRRRPYRAVGDGVELPREELRRIGASDDGSCARLTTRAVRGLRRSVGSRLGQPPTTSLCPALRLSYFVRLLLAMHGSHCCSRLLNFGAWLRAVWFRFVFFFVVTRARVSHASLLPAGPRPQRLSLGVEP